MSQTRRLRIHGDNIVECDRCLELIAAAFTAETRFLSSDPFRPAFEIVKDGKVLFAVDLIPGHGRWQIDLQQMLRSHGAPLREATDVLVAVVSDDGRMEALLLAIEFCSALPAGNNAWQRNGRALACATVGIPYLYFAEVGGVELDDDRSVKAPRFPNPIVPFSYLTASRAYRVVCLPVYAPSPSSSASIRTTFAPAFGVEFGRALVRALIERSSAKQAEDELTKRALMVVEILSAQRSHDDTLTDQEWKHFLDQPTAQARAAWLENKRTSWQRKSSGKVRVSRTFPRLIKVFKSASSLSVGAGGIPICLIPQSECAKLARKVQQLYQGSIADDVVSWLASDERPLVVVWITGFKPGGDDSRPDRGLVPLARMLFGDDARILSIVSGPGKAEMWRTFRRAPSELAATNGLWEAVYNLSDAMLADSATFRDSPHAVLTNRSVNIRRDLVAFPAVNLPDNFSEHDVDSTLHLLFSRLSGKEIYEAMCNPPGGDWSGVTLCDFKTGNQYRWTSLPRVSAAGGKRPDHVIQFFSAAGKSTLAVIESKDTASKLEDRIGSRMKTYMEKLCDRPPTISKAAGGDWSLYSGDSLDLFDERISIGAFCWTDLADMKDAIRRGQLDAAVAFEFSSGEQASLLHLKTLPAANFLVSIIRKAAENFGGRLKVQIH